MSPRQQAAALASCLPVDSCQNMSFLQLLVNPAGTFSGTDLDDYDLNESDEDEDDDDDDDNSIAGSLPAEGDASSAVGTSTGGSTTLCVLGHPGAPPPPGPDHDGGGVVDILFDSDNDDDDSDDTCPGSSSDLDDSIQIALANRLCDLPEGVSRTYVADTQFDPVR
jgi:hypothetical protein